MNAGDRAGDLGSRLHRRPLHEENAGTASTFRKRGAWHLVDGDPDAAQAVLDCQDPPQPAK
jgi:hypothetical protein